MVAAKQLIPGALAPMFALYMVATSLPGPSEGVDFRQFYLAALRLLHGGNPYAAGIGELGQHHGFLYPPFSALIFTPFTVISPDAASVVFGLICFSLVPFALWVMRVDDWRVYTVTLAWAPVVVGWQTGNETALLVTLIALVWVYRDRPIVAGVLTACAISMKAFTWPLVLWLLVTRRWRASGWALLTGVLVNALSWVLVGFNHIGLFLRVSSLDVNVAWRAGYSVAATLAPLGVAHATGSLLTLLASIALVLAVAYVGYVRRRDDQALTLMIVLSLVASPIVWNHYFLLLLVPMAIGSPRVSWLWWVPVLMWVCPYYPGAGAWQRPIAWALVATIVIVLLRPVRSESERRGSNPRPSAWEADALPTELRSRWADSSPTGRG